MSNINVWEDAEPGVKRKIMQPGESLMLMEVHFEPGAEGYEHAHPHEQLSYCMKGRMEFTIDGVKKVIGAGESVCIPPHARHGAKALETSILLDCFTPVREDLVKR
ncbi:cupin domain-containing protein [Paenibacillus sp. UNC499MF]|uniref:cupin domain-containing protein n=1 Tax=Paenibacillus sp. UNC499MF TaxID=1502751 RepID=UPI00089FED89|nr:cupin domain-containing protein [Paenibacillus sp. UNC499MF]SEG09191.1 Cupin domain-containing protein [Paenibacillus sp. UNC499MF]